jgi:hypothetical protein
MDSKNEGEGVVMLAENESSSDEESEAAEEEQQAMESDDESELDDDDDIYRTLVQDLQEGDEDDDRFLTINNIDEAQAILTNIDDFCQILADTFTKRRLDVIRLGDKRGGSRSQEEKIEISEENASTWNKLFSTLKGILGIGWINIHGSNLSGEVIARFLDVTSSFDDKPTGYKPTVHVHLPWWWTNEEDLTSLMKGLSSLENDLIYQMKLIGEYVGEESIASNGDILQLLRSCPWDKVALSGIAFTQEVSKELVDILSTDAFRSSSFAMNNCTFDSEGGELVARGLRDNTVLKSISLRNIWKDDDFCKALLHHLPSNAFAQELVCGDAPLGIAVSLIKSIAKGNNTLKRLHIFCIGNSEQLSYIQREDLKSVVSSSYTLEAVYLSRCSFDTITRLNKAGRRYLAEDAASRSKCIAVLAKVKNDLDCLFYHMRENPILCTGYTRSSDETNVGKTRKQSESC